MLRTISEKLIKRNNAIYESLVEIALSCYKKRDYEKTLNWITKAAQFAWEHHAGRFSDGRMESIVLEIGKKLDFLSVTDKIFPQISSKSNKSKVLHVATEVYKTGGHSRLIRNWIKAFPQYSHSLITTNQLDSTPDFLTDSIKISEGNIFCFPPDADLLTKAYWLRQISLDNYDYVFLHTHPHDVIALIAFAIENCPPVALINHADHVFWVGASVADLVIDFCSTGERISQERRFAKKTTIVPYLQNISGPTISRTEARLKLGISEEETTLISIGSHYKYKPLEKRNFFSTAEKVIQKNPSARLFLIGPEHDYETSVSPNDRMIFLGRVNNPDTYQIAADIYLEGFPISGGLASIETVLLGACPVFAYDSLPLFSTSRLLEFEGVVELDKTESDYIDRVSNLISNPSEREQLAESLRKRIAYLHSPEKIKDYHENTFAYLDTVKHTPAAIPHSLVKIEDEDISLGITTKNKEIEFPLILQFKWTNKLDVTSSELLKMLILSFQSGDTNLSFKHTRAWFGTIKETLLG